MELPAFRAVNCLISRRVSAALFNTSLSRVLEPDILRAIWRLRHQCWSLAGLTMHVSLEPVHQRGFLPVCCHGSLFRCVYVKCGNFPHSNLKVVGEKKTFWWVTVETAVTTTVSFEQVTRKNPPTTPPPPPVSEWLTARQGRWNSSGPCNSRSAPACNHDCASWAPLRGSRSCSGRCCRSGGTAGRAEGRWGYSSWRERRPTGSGCPHCSGYDWKEGERERERQREERETAGRDEINYFSLAVALIAASSNREEAASPLECRGVMTYWFLFIFFHLWPTFPHLLNSQTFHPLLQKSKGQIYF